MSTKLKAGTATSGAVIDADLDGILELQSGSTPTTAITVDASQRVGIGTASPTRKFVVADTGSDVQMSVINTGTLASDDAFILLQTNGTGTTSTISGLFFGDGDSVSSGRIYYNHDNDSMVLYTNATIALTLSSTGGVSIVRTAVTSPTTTDGNVFSGVYTPTLTNVTNIATSSSGANQYMRVGDTVTVSGQVLIDTTATGDFILRMSLPIASDFSASSRYCGGTFASLTVYGEAGAVLANAATSTAEFRGKTTSAASQSLSFTFTYKVI